MKIHKIKENIKYFADVLTGVKTFEIRKNDRDYEVGDILIMSAWTNDTEKYQTWGKGTYLALGTIHSDKPLFSDVKYIDEPISDYFPVSDVEQADKIQAKIIYMTDFEQKEGYVVLGISDIKLLSFKMT